MIVSTFNSSDLQECGELIREVADSINDMRLELVTKSKISQADSLEISKWVTTLNNRLNKIALGQIDEIVTDLQQPAKRIEKVTQKLDAAIEELKEPNKFVEILTNLTNLVSVILSPTSGLVKIAGIINQLDKLA
ncbi:hypothetical protein HW132_23355 [Brasilonema sp. CT11]|nr:hypothetical protein [Brasilonema sp. CT11]